MLLTFAFTIVSLFALIKLALIFAEINRDVTEIENKKSELRLFLKNSTSKYVGLPAFWEELEAKFHDENFKKVFINDDITNIIREFFQDYQKQFDELEKVRILFNDERDENVEERIEDIKKQIVFFFEKLSACINVIMNEDARISFAEIALSAIEYNWIADNEDTIIVNHIEKYFDMTHENFISHKKSIEALWIDTSFKIILDDALLERKVDFIKYVKLFPKATRARDNYTFLKDLSKSFEGPELKERTYRR